MDRCLSSPALLMGTPDASKNQISSGEIAQASGGSFYDRVSVTSQNSVNPEPNSNKHYMQHAAATPSCTPPCLFAAISSPETQTSNPQSRPSRRGDISPGEMCTTKGTNPVGDKSKDPLSQPPALESKFSLTNPSHAFEGHLPPADNDFSSNLGETQAKNAFGRSSRPLSLRPSAFNPSKRPALCAKPAEAPPLQLQMRQDWSFPQLRLPSSEDTATTKEGIAPLRIPPLPNCLPQLRINIDPMEKEMPSPLARRGAEERAYLQDQLIAEALRRKKQQQQNEIWRLRECCQEDGSQASGRRDSTSSKIQKVSNESSSSKYILDKQTCSQFPAFAKVTGLNNDHLTWRDFARSPPTILTTGYRRSVSAVLEDCGNDEDDFVLFFPDGVPLLDEQNVLEDSCIRENENMSSLPQPRPKSAVKHFANDASNRNSFEEKASSESFGDGPEGLCESSFSLTETGTPVSGQVSTARRSSLLTDEPSPPSDDHHPSGQYIGSIENVTAAREHQPCELNLPMKGTKKVMLRPKMALRPNDAEEISGPVQLLSGSRESSQISVFSSSSAVSEDVIAPAAKRPVGMSLRRHSDSMLCSEPIISAPDTAADDSVVNSKKPSVTSLSALFLDAQAVKNCELALTIEETGASNTPSKMTPEDQVLIGDLPGEPPNTAPIAVPLDCSYRTHESGSDAKPTSFELCSPEATFPLNAIGKAKEAAAFFGKSNTTRQNETLFPRGDTLEEPLSESDYRTPDHSNRWKTQRKHFGVKFGGGLSMRMSTLPELLLPKLASSPSPPNKSLKFCPGMFNEPSFSHQNISTDKDKMSPVVPVSEAFHQTIGAAGSLFDAFSPILQQNTEPKNEPPTGLFISLYSPPPSEVVNTPY